jgi:hypothetical protein
MTKAPISKGFAKFIEKNLKPGSKFDEARKAESMAGGCPLPVNTTGIALVGTIECTETKVKPDGTGGDPFIRVTLEVETPDEYQGKVLSGSGLMFVIKDGPNSTAADAFGRAMDFFEALGLPREIRTEMESFDPVIEYFTEMPRRVEYNVLEDTYKGNQSGKTIRAYAYVPEGEVETAETTTATTPSPENPDADYCEYLGKRYEVIEYDNDTEQYKLKNIATGIVREGIHKSKVKLD